MRLATPTTARSAAGLMKNAVKHFKKTNAARDKHVAHSEDGAGGYEIRLFSCTDAIRVRLSPKTGTTLAVEIQPAHKMLSHIEPFVARQPSAVMPQLDLYLSSFAKEKFMRVTNFEMPPSLDGALTFDSGSIHRICDLIDTLHANAYLSNY